MARLILVCMTLTLCFLETSGHGRLMEPPSRSSAWRKGFNTPINYNDNQLYCGGTGVQWSKENGGKCGICGDPWNGPRDNEAGGKYAKGVITAKWQEGQKVNIQVELTAYHKGYFEFRICPNNDVTKAATHECLDKYLLEVESLQGGKSTRYDINNSPKRSGTFDVTAYLPDNLACDQCVLQWKYNTGNSWGIDFDTGKGCIGCGPQEQFYGCADVKIEPKSGVTMTTTPGGEDKTVTTKPEKSTTKQMTTNPEKSTTKQVTTNPEKSTTKQVTTNPEKSTTKQVTTTFEKSTTEQVTKSSTVESTTQKLTTSPKESTTRQVTTKSEAATAIPDTTTKVTSTKDNWDSCKAAGAWAGNKNMTKWCKNNCRAGYCPDTHCNCGDSTTQATTSPKESTTKQVTTKSEASTTKPVTTTKASQDNWDRCRAVGEWAGDTKMIEWCKSNCRAGYCPKSHCYCGESTTKPAWDSCRAAGVWAGSSAITQWCKNNCSRGYCPSTHCSCP